MLFTDKIEGGMLKNFNKIYRIMCYRFMNEEAIPYIFRNKKIKHYEVLLKYRRIILKALNDPEKFVAWKIETKIE